MIDGKEKLVVVWTSADREVALKMVFMYVFNSKLKQWWDDVTMIIWGPSAKLLSEDNELQEYIGKIKKEGVKLEACLRCTDMYGVTQKLEALVINVKLMGEPLTSYAKEGRQILTF